MVHLLISPPTSGLDIAAVLPYFLAAGTALGAWFAARSTASAQLQKTLLDASRAWVEQSQEMLAQRDVRISVLEKEHAEIMQTLLERDGEIRGLRQYNRSLQAILVRAGLELPPDTRGRTDV